MLQTSNFQRKLNLKNYSSTVHSIKNLTSIIEISAYYHLIFYVQCKPTHYKNLE